MGNQVQPDGRRVFDDIYTFPQDSQDLADDIFASANVLSGTSAERQALPSAQRKPGMLWSETDTGAIYQVNGANWRVVSIPMTDYDPAPAGINIGNGSIAAKYVRTGNAVDVFLEMVGGSATAATGNVIFALPFLAAGNSAVSRNEGIGMFQTNTAVQFQVIARFTGGATAFNVHAPEVVSNYLRTGNHLSNTFPAVGAWANSRLYLHFRYEAAV